MHYDVIAIPDTEIPVAAEPVFQHVLTTYVSECNKTAGVWRAVPEDCLDFRPHERTNTIRTIFQHQLLSERRFFAQFVGTEEPPLEELLPLADVFLLPSSSESFGLVALEAMSAEVPVVASTAGGIPEVVDHGVTGYLHAPGHIEGFVTSVLKLLTNEPLRRRMGRRGRQVARERFDQDAMIDRYVKVYESLL